MWVMGCRGWGGSSLTIRVFFWVLFVIVKPYVYYLISLLHALFLMGKEGGPNKPGVLEGF